MAVGPNQVVIRDCVCCCACPDCFGHGYWSQLTLTISGCTNPVFNGSWVATKIPARFCTWIHDLAVPYIVIETGPPNAFVTADFLFGGGVPQFSGPWDPDVMCRDEYVLACTDPGFYGAGAQMTVTPVPGTWVTCGRDDEGTPIGDGLEEETEGRMLMAPPVAATPVKAPACPHLGGPTGEKVGCRTCVGRVELKVFACGVHGTCTVGRKAEGVACCDGCPDRPVAGT